MARPVRMTEAQGASLDLKPVAAAVDDVIEADARSDVPEGAAREDREAGSLTGGEPRERRPHRWRECGGLQRGDDRRERPIVVEDRNETGVAPEFLLQTREEAVRNAQEALTPIASTGIRFNSLSRSPAHR